MPHIIPVIKQLPLACKGSMQCNLCFMNNWSDWQDDPNALRDLGQLVLLQRSRESRNTETRTSLNIIECFFRAPCSAPPYQPFLISYQTQALSLKYSYLPWLSLWLLLWCSCLHSRNHTHITSAKCLLFVCCLLRGMWVCTCVYVFVCVFSGGEGVEGVEYLPWGYSKGITERQRSTEQ